MAFLQNYYLVAWAGLLALATLAASPSIYEHMWSKRWKDGGWIGTLGLYEDLNESTETMFQCQDGADNEHKTRRRQSPSSRSVVAAISLWQKLSRSTFPLPNWAKRLPFIGPPSSDASCHPTELLVPFTFGTLCLTLLVPTFICAAVLPYSDFAANPNRSGFIALASLPPFFLLCAKSSPITWLTGQSWTTFNFLQRWLGRAIVVLVVLHAYFWTAQWATPASGRASGFLSGDAQAQGAVAFAFLLIAVIASLKPIRVYAHSLYSVFHFVGMIGLLCAVNLHTSYAGKSHGSDRSFENCRADHILLRWICDVLDRDFLLHRSRWPIEQSAD